MYPTTFFDLTEDDYPCDTHFAHIDELMTWFLCDTGGVDGRPDEAFIRVVLRTAADVAFAASVGPLDWRRFDPEEFFETVPYSYGSEQRAGVANVLHNFFHWMIEAGHIGSTDGLCLVHTLGVFLRDELVPLWGPGSAARVWN